MPEMTHLILHALYFLYLKSLIIVKTSWEMGFYTFLKSFIHLSA